jgi:restriction system protein
MGQAGKMSFLAAAIQVLEECQRPLSTRELTEEVLRRGLVETGGKTPEATLSSHLYRKVRAEPKGRIVRVADPGQERAVRDTVRWTLRS